MLGETRELKSSGEEDEEEDSLSYVDDEDDEDYKVEGEKEEPDKEPAEKKQRRGRKGQRGARQRKKKEEEQEEEEDVTAGDVFALEMELNRENKKMMKVRRMKIIVWVFYSSSECVSACDSVCLGEASSQQAAPSAERPDGRSQHPLRQRRQRGCHLDVYGDHKTGYGYCSNKSNSDSKVIIIQIHWKLGIKTHICCSSSFSSSSLRAFLHVGYDLRGRWRRGKSCAVWSDRCPPEPVGL